MIHAVKSVLGAIFFREPGAAELVVRLERQRSGTLMTSAWTLTEMASIGGIKQRIGHRPSAWQHASRPSPTSNDSPPRTQM